MDFVFDVISVFIAFFFHFFFFENQLQEKINYTKIKYVIYYVAHKKKADYCDPMQDKKKSIYIFINERGDKKKKIPRVMRFFSKYDKINKS